MAFVAIANYTQQNYELGYALKFMRILNLILTALFGLYGYIAAVLIFILVHCLQQKPCRIKAISIRSYPLISASWPSGFCVCVCRRQNSNTRVLSKIPLSFTGRLLEEGNC